MGSIQVAPMEWVQITFIPGAEEAVKTARYYRSLGRHWAFNARISTKKG